VKLSPEAATELVAALARTLDAHEHALDLVEGLCELRLAEAPPPSPAATKAMLDRVAMDREEAQRTRQLIRLMTTPNDDVQH
jgi:hypothetical protein